MESLGKKISKYRIQSKISQTKLGNMLSVSNKTISSWENDRTIPDIDMIFKLSNIFNVSFYALALNEYANQNNLELEVKLKVDKSEYERIFKLIKKDSKFIGKEKQSAIYYRSNFRKFDNEYLRIRKENNIVKLNYKKKISDNLCEEYETIVDNASNLSKILEHLDMIKKGEINKNREIYLYKNKYEFAFDKVEDIGTFVEIEVKNFTTYEEEYNNLFKLLNELNISLKRIDKKRYLDYLDEK